MTALSDPYLYGERPVSRPVARRRWSLFAQSIYWIYLFCTVSNMEPFPRDFDGLAIKEASSSSLTQLTFLGLMMLSLLNFFMHRKRGMQNLKIMMPLLAPILLLSASLTVSSLASPYADQAVRKLLFVLISNFIFIATMLTAPSINALLKSTCLFLLFIVVISYIGVALYPVGAVHQTSLYAGSWRGITSHKNYMGGTLSLTILLFALYFRRRGKLSGLGIFAIGISSFFLLMTDSKTALVALILVWALSAIMVGHGFMGRAREAIALKYLIALGGTIFIFSFFYFGEDLLQFLGISSNLTGRLPIWDLIFQVMDRPILGYGYQAFFKLGNDSPLMEVSQGWFSVVAHAHNGYLNIFVFGGVPALLLIWYFYLKFISLGIRTSLVDRRARFCLSIMIFELIRNVTEVDAFTGARITWSLTLLAAYLILSIRHDHMHGRLYD